MTGRRPARFVVFAVVALVGVGLAWRLLSLGLAEHWSRSAPERALSWRGAHPAALLASAEQRVRRNPGDPRAAERARAALAANPLDGRAYRVLGQVAEAAGRAGQSTRLFATAAQLAPRDLSTHAWLQRRFLQQGRLDDALHHTDMMLRVEPQDSARQFALLRQLALVPQAQPAVVRLLARTPPWRTAFLLELMRKVGDSNAIAPLMAHLRLAPGGLTQVELLTWLDRLAGDRHWGTAYLVWAGSASASGKRKLQNVYNGSFELEPENGGFDWRFGDVPGATIERLPATGATGATALRLSFEDQRVPFQHVRQLLALPPGAYTLRGRAMSEGLRGPRGVVWDVICADTGENLAETPAVRAASPWRPFSADFSVPPDHCGGQWLLLRIPARIASEEMIGGRAWFDDLRIDSRR